MKLKLGLSHTSTKIVDNSTTAASYGSGNIHVFATPALVALMENAAMLAVAPYLPDGFTTVGIEISVKHTKATGIGKEVSCYAELVEIDGKKLAFKLNAFDKIGEIGSGTHIRFIVETNKFMAKVS
jgi:predicted thioesterase